MIGKGITVAGPQVMQVIEWAERMPTRSSAWLVVVVFAAAAWLAGLAACASAPAPPP